MLRECESGDSEMIYLIINDAAEAYKGIIPEDRWKEPYMSQEELEEEINAGIVFWGYEDDGELIGVMGVQRVKDVTLTRRSL